MTIRTVLPLWGSVTGIGTILLVYFLTKTAGHFLPGVITPPISLLGCQSPEHEVFQVGFTITGILLLQCVQIWKETFYPRLRDKHPVASKLALYGGYLAVVGVISQGLITLEHDFTTKITRGEPLSPQSVWHQLLASNFFLGAAVHCYATCYMAHAAQSLYFRTRQDLYSVWGSRAKLLCVLISMVAWPIAEALHPVATGKMISERQVNVGGLAQYVTVGAYICFFGSYSLDLWAQEERQTRFQKSN